MTPTANQTTNPTATQTMTPTMNPTLNPTASQTTNLTASGPAVTETLAWQYLRQSHAAPAFPASGQVVTGVAIPVANMRMGGASMPGATVARCRGLGRSSRCQARQCDCMLAASRRPATVRLSNTGAVTTVPDGVDCPATGAVALVTPALWSLRHPGECGRYHSAWRRPLAGVDRARRHCPRLR